VFVNEHFELEMESSVFERVVMRNRIRKYLVEIDTAAVAGRLHVDRLCRAVETYMIENAYKTPGRDGGVERVRREGANGGVGGGCDAQPYKEISGGDRYGGGCWTAACGPAVPGG